MGRYALIICPNCSQPQSADLTRGAVSCACGYRIDLKKMKPRFTSDSPLETARAVAMAKSQAADERMVMPSRRPPQGRYSKIARKAGGIKDPQERLAFIASALTELKSEFSLEDLERVQALLRKGSANDMLVAMRESGLIWECSKGKYRSV